MPRWLNNLLDNAEHATLDAISRLATEVKNRIWQKRWSGRAQTRREVNGPWPAK